MGQERSLIIKPYPMINKLKFITALFFLIGGSVQAQDWNGSSSNNFIYRTGNVSIGGSYSGAKFSVMGTQSTTHFFHGTNEDLYLRPGKVTGRVLFDVGYLGIGTLTPSSLFKLSVEGDAIFGGHQTTSRFRIEATDEAGAPARAVGLELHGYEGRAKGIYISDKNTSHKWFFGEAYALDGLSIGYTTGTQVEYGANSKFFINPSGNVGIGTLDVNGYRMNVNGNSRVGGNRTQTVLRIEATDEAGANAKAVGLELHGYEGRGKGIYISDKNTSHKWFIGEGYNYAGLGIGYSTSNNTEYKDQAKLFINTSGQVGIGTTNTAGYRLAVAGNIITEKVKVAQQANWSDFVFESGYQLPSLAETDQYIQQNGRLQGIPSAEEVKEEGYELGDMDAKLLQKIEELTLHLIRMDKEMKALKDKNNELEKRLDQKH